MKKPRAVYVLETRVAGMRPGVWTDWAPWLPFQTKIEAMAILDQQIVGHAKCCQPPRDYFRVRKYVPEVTK